MLKFFKKATHEPINLQIGDVKKYYPEIAEIILKGSDCDSIKDAYGPFGSINNPIPVNGSIGEIKYLAKLRGKTGQAVFFHRIASIESKITENPIDKYEIVCLDNTQWTELYFDLYHPRRSNKSPKGFSLMPFNENLKMDLPFGFGVDYFVPDFPYGLPSILEKEVSVAISRRAKARLEKSKFINPYLKPTSGPQQNKSIMLDNKGISKEEYPTSIEHYSFFSGFINKILSIEKDLIRHQKDNLKNFKSPLLFNNHYHVRFMIERYLYLRAYLGFLNQNINLQNLHNYIGTISSEEYGISIPDSLAFMKNRIDFYQRELEMLSSFKYPHPGKIIWCMHNPSTQEITDGINTMFEENLFAGMYLLGIINDTFKTDYTNYSRSFKNSNEGTEEAAKFFQMGIQCEKSGDYENALENLMKAESINPKIDGLSAHILISKFWTGEYDVEKDHEFLYDSLTDEILKNPNLYSLYETRAWLCYHVLNNIELDKNEEKIYSERSENDFNFCISKDPFNHYLYSARALLFSSQKEYYKALKDLNRAVKLQPTISQIYYDRALVYRALNEFLLAKTDIENAISTCINDRQKERFLKFNQDLEDSMNKETTEGKL